MGFSMKGLTSKKTINKALAGIGARSLANRFIAPSLPINALAGYLGGGIEGAAAAVIEPMILGGQGVGSTANGGIVLN